MVLRRLRLKTPSCPPGVLCLSSGIGLLIILGIGILAILIYMHLKNPSLLHGQALIQPSTISVEEKQPIQIFNTQQSGDDRYTRSPEPYRSWFTTPDLRGAIVPPGAIPINIPTRYYPESFQQMGLLKMADKLLPLYGRRNGTSTDRYNYYTRTDTYNPVQIPISYQRKNCMDVIGCQELFGGEEIKVHGLDAVAAVEVYKYDAPRYIPSVV
jgi:hypothetical protein